jgi:PAS domain S-box-containing protein
METSVPRYVLEGGGQVGDVIRRHDWKSSPLGEPDLWPQPLKTLVSMMLGSNQPMFVAWGSERIVLYNDGYREMLQDRHPAAMGMPFSQLWWDIIDDVGPILDRAYAGDGTHMDDIAFMMTRDGRPQEAHFSFSYTPIRDETGEVSGMFCACAETTTAVLATRHSVESHDRLFEMSRDLFARATFDGFLETINPAWAKALGRSDAELKSRPFADIIHPDDLPETAAVIAELKSGRPVHQFHVRLLTADGIPLSFAWTAIPDNTPGSNAFYTSGRDITEDLRLEEMLRQSQKMEAVGQLTGGLAHDFNNLLTGISGALELVRTRLAQGRVEDVAKFIMAAENAATRAAALTHRLLAFSRRQTLAPRPTDVRQLITGMEDMINRTVGPTIDLEVVNGLGLWPSLIDPSQLENAILNLCLNARDAMPDGGKITIETGNRWLDHRMAQERGLVPAQYISLSVSDTGTGMPPDVVAKAFDPFFTTKPIGLGTGLGLSMIYGFARQSGGAVNIYSEIDLGTTITIYLPRHHGDIEEDDSLANLTEVPRANDGETVLVIDDEPTVRMLVSEVLAGLGYVALEAEDGPTGLQILNSAARIDLLVTDVGLPGGLNGRQVADAARAKRPDLKILFITGYAENAVLSHGHLDPGMHVITKPFAMDALATRIRDLIELQKIP